MVSIVVCSINPHHLSTLQKKVDQHIGVGHEWLIWDNRLENAGLCEVYNKMAERAVFPFICFLHEDLVIETEGWGRLLTDICMQQSIGLLGVAGGKYKSKMFSGWYSGGNRLDYFSVTHLHEGIEENICIPAKWDNHEAEVATVDGIFMLCSKEAWATTRFNDALLKGFHCYDIDFSLRVAQSFKVVVTNRLQIIHFTTGGDFGDNWVEQTILYHNAVQSILPFSVAANIEHNIDIIVAKYWLDWLKNMKINQGNKLRWISLQKLYKYPALYYGIVKFLLYKPLRLKFLHHSFKRIGSGS